MVRQKSLEGVCLSVSRQTEPDRTGDIRAEYPPQNHQKKMLDILNNW